MDRQLVVFAGKPDGSIELVDRRVYPEAHIFIREAGNREPLTWSVAGEIDAHPDSWEDALKISGCDNLTVYADVVRGGNEDVVDINHSRNCSVFINDAHPRGNFVLTCKGESDNITLTVYRQRGHGKEVDYDYGNHSDQGDGTTKNSRLSVKGVLDGGPAVVRVLRATTPQLDGGPFKFAFPNPKPKWFHDLVVWFLNLFQ